MKILSKKSTGRAFLRLSSFLKALYSLIIGTILGLLFLETLLHVNPHLLVRGMNSPAPIEVPLQKLSYDVYESDGDLFIWIPQLIRPISLKSNRLEARVTYWTDEFGFPNRPPLPEKADVVVLGRSYSMGAQVETPWPRILEKNAGWRVVNLSQTGNDLPMKGHYLKEFGLPRLPRWVIVEVLPGMDILGYEPRSATLLQDLGAPLVRRVGERFIAHTDGLSFDHQIFPLSVDISPGKSNMVFFPLYLSVLSVDKNSLENSRQWTIFQQNIISMDGVARASGACLALLFVPTNAEVYLPLANIPAQLDPSLPYVTAWTRNEKGDMVKDDEAPLSTEQLIKNAPVVRDLLAQFSNQNNYVFLDPTPALQEAVLKGSEPFLHYDTHWSAYGHRVVAQVVQDALEKAGCP